MVLTQDYCSLVLIVCCMKWKPKDVFKDFNKDEEVFDFRNLSSKSKYYDHSSKLIVGEIKDEISGVGVKGFVGLKERFIHSW